MGSKPARTQKEDYTRSDMEELYCRGEWHSWKEAIDWLRSEGEHDYVLRSEAVRAMERDLFKLQLKGKKFVFNPARAFEMAHAQKRK